MSIGSVPIEEAHTVVEHWISRPNIVLLETGVKTVGGRETGEQAIVVGVVQKKSPATLTALDFPVPPTVEVDVIEPDGSIRRTAVPTDVIETGAIRPMSSLSEWQRPCPGGFRISIPSRSSWLTPWNWLQLPSGTLGVTAYYRNKRCLFTNSHVIADRSGGPGQPVYQPEPAIFEYWSSNMIGVCDGTFEITTYPSATQSNPVENLYDFAWCEVPQTLTSHAVYDLYDGAAPLDIDRLLLSDEVMWIGAATGVAQYAKIVNKHAIAMTEQGAGTFAYWRNLISLSGGTGKEGDSGSALLSRPHRNFPGTVLGEPTILGLISCGSAKQPSKVMATRIPPDNGSPHQKMRI